MLESKEYEKRLERSNHISHQEFAMKFNSLSGEDYIKFSHFEKKGMRKISAAVAWQCNKTHTYRNRYKKNYILSTCVLLQLMSKPGSWSEVELLFGRNTSELSETLRVSVE